MKLDFRQRLLTTTLIVGVGALATPAFAQTTPPPANPTDTAGAANAQPETTTPQEGQTAVPSTNAQGSTVKTSQDIVITGTRIPQPNLTSASPVTVLSSQEIKLQGTTRTEDLINSLPQAFASQGSNISNGASGTANLNLRGLGSVRTLVLVNGRRLQPGDPTQGSVADINFIPSSLIKRVDVLTGGASSVYGADAVAGVVNFIMDTNFTGLRIDAQASTFMHDNRASSNITNADVARGFLYPKGLSVNGGAQDISAAFGTNFADGRGHIMAYATYRHQDSVYEASRDYSFCALAARASLGSGTPPRDFNCGGSATSNFTSIFLRNFANPHAVVGNQLVPGTIPFNFAPYNFFQRPDERYTLGTFAEYEISPGAKPYLEAMFMNDTSDAQIAPGGNFFNTGSVNCDNPLLSAQELSIICGAGNTFVDAFGVTRGIAYIGRRNVEGGPRITHLEHTSWRVVAGMKGDLLRGLSYDTYYQFGTTRLASVNQNNFSTTKLGRAVDVVSVLNGAIVAPGTAGAVIECRSVFNGTDTNCVPYNVFQTGGVTQAALNYLQIPAILNGRVDETIADANMTLEGGEYGLQTPWSDRGVGLNVGAEYRKESLLTQPDEALITNDISGNGAPTLPVDCPANSGKACSFDVRELFGEIQIPIVSHSFIEDFTLTGGYRYSDYKVANNHFSTNTYKIAAELAPVRDIRLRASYNRAVRAPNVVELFSQQFVGLGGTVDYCAGPAVGGLVNGFTAAQCANSGVTAGQFGNITPNPANQYNAEFGGNPNLSPEKADTYTAGVVLQPRWIPGLALTADYFNIKIKNLIGVLPFQTILKTCITSNSLCNLVNRAPNGSLWAGTPPGFVQTTNINVGGESTRGFDFNGSYAHKFGGLGTLNVSYVGTYLKTLDFDTGVGPKFNCVGFFGNTCGTPNPKYRHKLRLGFTLPDGIGISGQWRYFGSVKLDCLSSDTDLSCAPKGPADEKIAAQSFFDLALTARVADKFSLRLGANNILDKSPPIVGGEVSNAPFGNGNTYPQVYDSLGRYIFAGVTVDF